jgi:esterase/lipase superfamily enzyme
MSASAGDPQKLKVFISYSRRDALDFANQLFAALAAFGFQPSLDLHGISGAEDWEARLGTLILEADSVAFVLTPESMSSPICGWEIAKAKEFGKRIMPVAAIPMGEAKVPEDLRRLNYIFFYRDPAKPGSGFGSGLADLIAALNTDVDWLREHTRLLARATEWSAAGGTENRLLSGADISAAKAWAAQRPRGAPEPTALHLDYIRASENADEAHRGAERQRLDEMAAAQASREEALRSAETAQLEKLAASRQLVRRTVAGMVISLVLTIAATAAGLSAWSNQRAANVERQRAERNLKAVSDALSVLDTEANPIKVAEKFFSLANNYLSQNLLDEAVTLYKRSLAILDKQLGPASAETVTVGAQLGAVFVKQRDYAEAEPLFKTAMAYYEQTKSTDDPNVSPILKSLHEIYLATGRQAEAADIDEKARAISLANAADILPVFFATDRAQEPTVNRLAYGGDRGHRLELGQAIVAIPRLHQVTQVERPWKVRLPYLNVDLYEAAEDPSKNVTILKLSTMAGDALAASAKDRLSKSQRSKDAAFVFIPGFNTSFDNAIFRTALLAYDLNFDGVPFVYSWPSSGEVQRYTYDRMSAEQAEPYLSEFLKFVREKSGAKRVSIIAYGMGNAPLLAVLRQMRASNPSEAAIDQLVLVGPDIDRDQFKAEIAMIRGIAKDTTLYVTSSDPALDVSRAFWNHARAGDNPADGPVIVEGVDTIDMSSRTGGDVWSLPSISLLGSERRTDLAKRSGLVERKSSSGVYWAYPPR